MSKAIESLSLFFPFFNEEANVESVVRRSLEVVGEITDDFEILIVDDGSTDRTREIAERLVAENPSVRLVRHEKNLGYGAALISGYQAASKQWVFYTDGDNQFDIAELKDVARLADKYDVVACYRKTREDNLVRRLNSFAWSTLVNNLFDLKVCDVNCAFKLIRSEIFNKITLLSQGALIDTELLARAKNSGYSIGQHGVNHYPRKAGEQTGGNPKVIAKAFAELFKLRKDLLNEGRVNTRESRAAWERVG